jgi:hypothetical protein
VPGNDGNQAPPPPRDPIALANLIGDIATGQVAVLTHYPTGLRLAFRIYQAQLSKTVCYGPFRK